ncbi:MAG: ABC transporter substrate-binding protein [Oscillospiraceae bacterium]
MKKLTIVLLVICMLLVPLTACGQKPATEDGTDATSEVPAELPVLRVSLLPYMNALPAIYAIEKGYDIAEGFKIETSIYSLGAPMLEALASNLWDVGCIGTGGAPMSVTTYDCKIVADTTVNCNEMFVRKDSKIAAVKGANKDFADVFGDAASAKGAKVLVPTGSVQQQLVLIWLEKIGLTQNDVEFVHMEPASAYQAFIAGEGDIIACAPPYNFQLRDEYIKAADFSMLGVRLADVVIVNPKSYDSQKELITKFLKVFYKASDELIADPELCAQKELEWKTDNGMTTTIEDCRLEVEATEMVSSKMAHEGLPGESIKMIAGFLADQGKIEKDLIKKFDTNLSDEYLKAALK